MAACHQTPRVVCTPQTHSRHTMYLYSYSFYASRNTLPVHKLKKRKNNTMYQQWS